MIQPAAIAPKEVIINSDTILNSLADGVVVISSSRRILYINKAAKELFTIAGDENMEGRICREVIHHSNCSLCCLMTTAVNTGEEIHNKEVTIGKGDKTVTLSVNAALLKDEAGKTIGAVEVFRDISLLKELKQELRDKYSFEGIIGKNYKMHEIYELLREVAPTKTTVLIEGESGTGKELIANAIHNASPRKDKSFIKVNCAALAEGVLESELFGHVKGAFTGAIADKPGRFEMANGGTIFLDEIGDITQHTQVKLLRVLQESTFERVGGTKTIKVDVRLITATNKNLKTLVEEGKFREDLYYRLKVMPVTLPPLRERKDDIPLLVSHFITRFNKDMGKNISGISPSAMEILMAYNYPGNIRELEHIIEHGFVRCSADTILPEHMPKDMQRPAQDIISKAIKTERPLDALERETIIRLLEESNWKIKDCANKLKISRITLWRKMKELGIKKGAC
ncbi:MAG: sigma 54-interacting transcriptional regulator [Deltaproteobacteria bacterium]|nr:sigma 54-interacting transcriptional regulator [Deltaproteobacteria bacterium]